MSPCHDVPRETGERFAFRRTPDFLSAAVSEPIEDGLAEVIYDGACDGIRDSAGLMQAEGFPLHSLLADSTLWPGPTGNLGWSSPGSVHPLRPIRSDLKLLKVLDSEASPKAGIAFRDRLTPPKNLLMHWLDCAIGPEVLGAILLPGGTCESAESIASPLLIRVPGSGRMSSIVMHFISSLGASELE
mmetsp:Transcript_95811/g.175425  ORF Transcript_95811/g.175425 Transcript_95811/m.175425 type:complete len:187 (-) Transcript_95811:408-968(-)